LQIIFGSVFNIYHWHSDLMLHLECTTTDLEIFWYCSRDFWSCICESPAPISPLRARLIQISSSYWTIYRSFDIVLEWELDWNSNPMLYANPSLQKNVQCDMNY